MKNKRLKTPPSKEELLPYIDYLHGFVVDGQFRAACQYEYARTSNILRRAAEVRKSAGPVEVSFKIEEQFHCDPWFFMQPEWYSVWRCPSFPAKSWNQLADTERADLLRVLPLSSTDVRPLQLAELIFLTRVFHQFTNMTEKARAEMKEATAAGKPRQKVYPVLEVKNSPLVHVLLPFDFSKTRQRLLKEIDLWLRLPENKARFDTHKRTKEAGTGREAKDRLKDLAAWKLFRELGWQDGLDFAEQHRKRDKSGKRRAFHDPRQGRRERGKLTKVPTNEATLYSRQTGESAFRKAGMRVGRHLAELIPWEFGRFAEEEKKWLSEATERFRNALKAAQASTKNC